MFHPIELTECGRARWVWKTPKHSPTRQRTHQFQLPSLVFPSGGSGNARQSSCNTTRNACDANILGLHQNTPSGRKVARHSGVSLPKHTHTLRRTGLCNWVQLALLPIGYQYEPFRFVCAGRGDATDTALHRPSLQSDHPRSTRLCFGTATGCPVTARSRQHSRLLLRGGPIPQLLDPGCLATRPIPCKVVNRHGTGSETPGPFAWYVYSGPVCFAQEVRTYVQVISSPRSG